MPIVPGSPEWRARLEEWAKPEADAPEAWYYLPFMLFEPPNPPEFQGGAFVRARGPATAKLAAYDLGIRPAGESLPAVHPETMPAPPAELQNRLLTRAELDAWVATWTLAQQAGIVK